MFGQSSAIGRRARVVMVIVAVTALSTAVAVGTSSGARSATPTIAFVSQGTSNSWAAQLDAVARKTAKQLGVKLVYYNGQGDATKQLPELQTAIATHPDAMVVVPLGQAADTGPVERAMSAGIPVVLCDSKINSDKYTSLVNPNPATATVPRTRRPDFGSAWREMPHSAQNVWLGVSRPQFDRLLHRRNRRREIAPPHVRFGQLLQGRDISGIAAKGLLAPLDDRRVV